MSKLIKWASRVLAVAGVAALVTATSGASRAETSTAAVWCDVTYTPLGCAQGYCSLYWGSSYYCLGAPGIDHQTNTYYCCSKIPKGPGID